MIQKRIYRSVFIAIALLFNSTIAIAQIKVSTFNVDASPPIGSPLAYDPTTEIQSPLSCRGIVIQSKEKPIVLCSIDWLGVANDAQVEFKKAFAESAGTTPDRVSIHAVHQHDASRCDFSAEKVLSEFGYGKKSYDVKFCRSVIKSAAAAISKSLQDAKPVTHLGTGQANVEKVASNRRLLGPDGKVKFTRYTATKDPAIRAMKTGTIDPSLKSLSFWNHDQAIVVLTFYATHPQSYYRTGKANPDFPGLARNARETQTGIPHIHFNGAGGNIGAGKWNDGSVSNRAVLAGRVQQGMAAAFDATKKTPIDSSTLSWKKLDVQLPVSKFLNEERCIASLKNKKETESAHLYAAKHLVWLRRSAARIPIQVSCLTINESKTVFMPGELFVEYQLESQELAPDSFVSMAAYGEYGMGYIGTAIGYTQGGYETSANASRVGPGSERALMDAAKKLLK